MGSNRQEEGEIMEHSFQNILSLNGKEVTEHPLWNNVPTEFQDMILAATGVQGYLLKRTDWMRLLLHKVSPENRQAVFEAVLDVRLEFAGLDLEKVLAELMCTTFAFNSYAGLSDLNYDKYFDKLEKVAECIRILSPYPRSQALVHNLEHAQEILEKRHGVADQDE